MTAQELYQLLNAHGIDYEVVEIFDGVRLLRFPVATFEEAEDSIRMRDDLALEGLAVPACRTFKDYDTMVDVAYITAEELDGAVYGNDPAHPDDHPFCYVQLKDGRSLYFLSVDLDFGKPEKLSGTGA